MNTFTRSIFTCTIALIALLPFAAQAKDCKPDQYKLQVPLLGIECISEYGEYIAAIYNVSIAVVGIISVIMIMVGGFMYIGIGITPTPDNIGSAKKIIANALVGLLLVLTSWLILQTVNPELLRIKTPKSIIKDAQEAAQQK